MYNFKLNIEIGHSTGPGKVSLKQQMAQPLPMMCTCVCVYTGWLVTGGTSGKGVILREKRSRKYRIKIFRLRLCFRENRL